LLKKGTFRGDGVILGDNLINSSLNQLGADVTETASYESMLLDAATVFYGRNANAAVCAWQATHESAAYKFEQLLDYSLVKIVTILYGYMTSLRVLLVGKLILRTCSLLRVFG
jgi:hypothetical protein